MTNLEKLTSNISLMRELIYGNDTFMTKYIDEPYAKVVCPNCKTRECMHEDGECRLEIDPVDFWLMSEAE